MKNLLKFTILSTFVGLGSVAHAADVTPVGPSWTGFYAGIGVGGGYGSGNVDAIGEGDFGFNNITGGQATPGETFDTPNFVGGFTAFSPGSFGDTGTAAALSSDNGAFGVLGRAEIGADYQIDRFVVGLNAAFTLSQRSASSQGGGDGGGIICAPLDDDDDDCAGGEGQSFVKSDFDFGNSWSVGGRLGFLVNDSTLLFAAGGYTQADIKLKTKFEGESSAGDASPPQSLGGAYNISASDGGWQGGYYLGGGLETMLMDHVSLKLEYRYSDYGSVNTSKVVEGDNCVDGPCNAGYFVGVKSSADVYDQSVMATFSYRMN